MKKKIEKLTFDTHEASEYLGISESALRQSRMKGEARSFDSNKMICPPHVKIGRKVLYLKADLDKWFSDSRVGSLRAPIPDKTASQESLNKACRNFKKTYETGTTREYERVLASLHEAIERAFLAGVL